MKNTKLEKTYKKTNIQIILRNFIYQTYAKVFILVLISLLIFSTSASCLKIMSHFLEKPEIVANVYAQRTNFNYETSKPFKAEVKKCFDNILKFSLIYSDIDNFKFSDSIQIYNKDETKRAEENIEMVKYLAGIQIEKNEYDEEYLNEGFIEFEKTDGKNQTAKLNEQAIKDYYFTERDKFVEEYKKTLDSDYCSVVEYLEALDGVKYAVVDHTTDRIYSNLENAKKENLRKAFSESKNSLMVFNSQNPYYAATELKEFSSSVEELAKNYEQNFDFYVAFDSGLYFNENCKQFENQCREMYGEIFTLSLKAALSCVFSIVLSVVLMSITGKREYKGAVKYCITDRIPNDIHFIFHLIIQLSMVIVVDNSFYLIFHPNIHTSYWKTMSPDFLIFKMELCCVIFALIILAMLCCFKRQYKNKTLLKNTVLYRFLRILKKSPSQDNLDD